MSLFTNFSLSQYLQSEDSDAEESFWSKYLFLMPLLLALAIDLITPYFISHRMIPSAVRWLADAAIAGMIVLVFARMMAFDRIPLGALALAGMSIIWILVGLFENQGVLTTVWGWWRMFKYPAVGIFVYLHQAWPENIPLWLKKGLLGVLTFEVAMQGWQYFSGVQPGDHLAGTFGRHGVGPLFMFTIFVLCLALGQWLAQGKSRMLIWTLVLGSIASGLGEIKFFPFAVVAVAAATMAIHMIRGGQIQKLLIYIGLFAVVVPTFFVFYNNVVATESNSKRLEDYFELDTTEAYLNNTYVNSGGRFYIGRGFALQLGWQVIQRDMTTFLFGYGLGARSESKSLGLEGAGLQNGYYGTSGTSLLVMMQELGTVGLTIFALFILWVALRLFRDARRDPDSDLNVLRYAILLYTITWPLWIWYHQVWDYGVTMGLYWATLGYLISRSPSRTNQTPDLQPIP